MRRMGNQTLELGVSCDRIRSSCWLGFKEKQKDTNPGVNLEKHPTWLGFLMGAPFAGVQTRDGSCLAFLGHFLTRQQIMSAVPDQVS